MEYDFGANDILLGALMTFATGAIRWLVTENRDCRSRERVLIDKSHEAIVAKNLESEEKARLAEGERRAAETERRQAEERARRAEQEVTRLKRRAAERAKP